MKGDDIAARLVALAMSVVKIVDALPEALAGRHVAGQLLRSGTSPGANYEEARGAESRRDFLHKVGIALKELQETRYWLRVVAGRTWFRAMRCRRSFPKWTHCAEYWGHPSGPPASIAQGVRAEVPTRSADRFPVSGFPFPVFPSLHPARRARLPGLRWPPALDRDDHRHGRQRLPACGPRRHRQDPGASRARTPAI